MRYDARLELTRRQFFHVGIGGTFGLSLAQFLQAEAQTRAARKRSPKSLIFLFLYGGPSQIDTWDMKPEAPVEYRGEFKPLPPPIPGLYLCEYLPRMAAWAKHFSVIRTLHHSNRNHQPAGCRLFTGVDPGSDNAAQLAPKPNDPPALGSLAVKAAPPAKALVPPFVMLPARLHDQGSAFKGQHAGWLGHAYDPLLIEQDPASPNFRVEGFSLPANLSLQQLEHRRWLLEQLEPTSATSPERAALRQFQKQALDLLLASQGRAAFDLSAEPDKLRDRYGRNRFGQGCLLARRLIEAGARVVTVSDCTANGHHEWDTHQNNFKRLKEVLLPRLDQAFSALMEDLHARGLLEETVVYVGGEFGRTPRVGQAGFSGAGASKDGRDHYPNCFPGLLAGGYVRPGIIYGESDSKAAYPAKDPVTIEDLVATIFAAMGLDPHTTITSLDGRPMPLAHGRPITNLIV
ncbi:MAG: DUF1501 domain-containing protein [Gemmatales bacterium]|nr:DUF1501 domain-containing protein [Gemmatales bacterium]MDW8174254.1 DUF1501 domain-containing protein [Gemmatales bacterium]